MIQRMHAEAPCEPAAPSAQPKEETTLDDAAPRKARDLMKIGVKTIAQDASIYKAIQILVERRISGLPVMDGHTLVGIITEKDMLQLVLREQHLPGPVEQYMTREVVAFNEEDDVSRIWACLVENSFRRVPILRDNKLTGIVTRTDLLRARFAELCPGSSWQMPGRPIPEPRVRDVMTCGLLTTSPDAPVIDAIELLLAHAITGLPVVDDSMRLLGIVSEKDILKLFDAAHAQAWRVRDIMTSDVISFDVHDSLFEVCKCLARNGFRRVPVLDRGRLVGIVSRADLIVYILKNRAILFREQPAPCQSAE